jgi:plasmid maintenance system antidote protein VapI
MNVNPLLAGLRSTHPGEVLREDVLPALGRSKVEIAGLAMQMAYDLRAARKAIANDLASIPTLDADEIG